MSALLEINHLSKAFGGLNALQEVHLRIEQGETHAIIGPNGAGKSTLLHCCIGRLQPDSGEIRFDQMNIIGNNAHDINAAGMVRVFQTPEIFPDLSLLFNVMIPALAKRDGTFRFNLFRSLNQEHEIEAQAKDILIEVGLDKLHVQNAGSLSRGDKRRLELAMALVQEPRLLLLDEPTAGMARHDTHTTIELLKKIKQRGMTQVIIEHDMHVVFSLADRISVLAQGRMIASGPPDEIRHDPKVKEAYLGESDDG